MNQIKDPLVMRLVERIGEHYRTNIANRFIRPALLQMSLDKSTWNQIETLTEKFEQFHYQGFHIEELYRQISAVARFIVATRREVAPTIRYRLPNGGSSPADRVLRDMAVSTFAANLQLFAEMIFDLYSRLQELDTAATTKGKPIYQQMPELDNIADQLLNG